jgi:hypothetical protein
MGWKKDRYDSRDYLHVKLPPPKIPDSFSLIEFLPEVRDQGRVGSCVGFGIGGNLTGLAKKLGTFLEWFSPTWIYNGARFLEGTLTQDSGAYPRDALEWIKKNGCLLESLWPYDPQRLDKSAPPSSLIPEAQKRPILEYYRVTSGVEGICSAIASGYFVSIGTPWFNKWMETEKGGILAEIHEDDIEAGGHETFLYGYNKTQGYFYGINSWGKDWGINGRFAMLFSAFDVFKKFGGYDAHYVIVNWDGEPEPEPEKKRFPWWIVLAGIAIAGIIIYILCH